MKCTINDAAYIFILFSQLWFLSCYLFELKPNEMNDRSINRNELAEKFSESINKNFI